MLPVHAVLREAAAQLAELSDTPRLDGELLLAHALGMSRTALLTRPQQEVDTALFTPLLRRRLNHEPIAYILGTWEFFSLEFLVRPPVLVPRPETEHLVEAALVHLRGNGSARVLDLCTGTGCVALSIAHSAPGAHVQAVDLQPHAVQLANENATRLGLAVSVYQGDLFAALPASTAPYDVITANPPYISPAEYAELSPVIQKHEDPVALISGEDGLDLVRRILNEAPQWLREGGVLAIEIGDTQSAAVRAHAEGLGWQRIAFLPDLAGHLRIFTAIRPA